MNEATREAMQQAVEGLLGLTVIAVIVVLGGSAVAAAAVRIFCAIVG